MSLSRGYSVDGQMELHKAWTRLHWLSLVRSAAIRAGNNTPNIAEIDYNINVRQIVNYSSFDVTVKARLKVKGAH